MGGVSRVGLVVAAVSASIAVGLSLPAASSAYYYYAYDDTCVAAVTWTFTPPLEATPSSGTVTISYGSNNIFRCAQAGATVYEDPPQAYPNANAYLAWNPTTTFSYQGTCAAALLSGISHPGLTGEIKGASNAYITGVRDPWSLVSFDGEVHHLVPAAQTTSQGAAALQCGPRTASGFAAWSQITGGQN